MSVIVRPAQFRTNIKPLESSEQAQLRLWLQLGFSAVMPPTPNAWRGADARDCELAIERIKLATAAYKEFCLTLIASINENVEMGRKIQPEEFVECVDQAAHDAIAVLELIGDRQSGR